MNGVEVKVMVAAFTNVQPRFGPSVIAVVSTFNTLGSHLCSPVSWNVAMARARGCSGFSTSVDSQLAPARASTLIASELSAESLTITVSDTDLSPDARRVTPAANFTFTVPAAHRIPSQLSLKVVGLSVAGRTTLAVDAAELPGFWWEISNFHSLILKPVEPVGEEMAILALSPRASFAGVTASVTFGAVPPERLANLSFTVRVTAPAVRSAERIQPPAVVLGVVVVVPIVNSHESPARGLVPSLVTWTAICAGTMSLPATTLAGTPTLGMDPSGFGDTTTL